MGSLKEEIYQALTECENIKQPEKLLECTRELVILSKYSDNPDLILTFYTLYTITKEFSVNLGEFRDLVHELKSYFLNDDYGAMLVVIKNFVAKKVREW